MIKVFYTALCAVLLAIIWFVPESRVYIVAFTGLGIIVGYFNQKPKGLGIIEGIIIGAITGSMAWFLIMATTWLSS